MDAFANVSKPLAAFGCTHGREPWCHHYAFVSTRRARKLRAFWPLTWQAARAWQSERALCVCNAPEDRGKRMEPSREINTNPSPSQPIAG